MCKICVRYVHHVKNLAKKTKYFLTVHDFVVIMSTSPFCAYINVFSSHYNSRQITVLNIFMYMYICMYMNIYILNIYIYMYLYICIYYYVFTIYLLYICIYICTMTKSVKTLSELISRKQQLKMD